MEAWRESRDWTAAIRRILVNQGHGLGMSVNILRGDTRSRFEILRREIRVTARYWLERCGSSMLQRVTRLAAVVVRPDADKVARGARKSNPRHTHRTSTNHHQATPHGEPAGGRSEIH